jgi:hypothetical protein
MVEWRYSSTFLDLARWKFVVSSTPRPQVKITGKGKIKMSLCITNEALRHEDVWGSGCIDPHFLDLGTSWR